LLSTYLCEHAPALVAGRRCVEVGAGLGLVGLVAARLGPARVLLTDMVASQPLLERNIARNAALHPASGAVLRAAELLWGDAEQLAAAGPGQWDLVLASDLIYGYNEDLVRALVGTVHALLAPGGALLVAYEHRENWLSAVALQDGCKAAGLLAQPTIFLDENDDDMLLYVFTAPA
jgi:predicted nicotinamide N-methyase